MTVRSVLHYDKDRGFGRAVCGAYLEQSVRAPTPDDVTCNVCRSVLRLPKLRHDEQKARWEKYHAGVRP